MQSILTRDPVEEAPAPQPETSEDFEIVLGKRQLAGVLFVAIVFLVVFSAVSYIAGEAMSPRHAAAAERPASPPASAPVTLPPAVEPVLNTPKSAPAAQPPVFADVKKGELYLQIGSVDKGTATIMVEGLRTHGFDAFAASGNSENIFRVLVGPFADHDAYRRTKDAISDIGLTAFGRRFEP